MRIDLIGDSTQTNNAGYGRGFCANLTSQVDCVNMSKGGASTRTFREQGLWQRGLETKPDYMLIQFGHNDMATPDHNPRETTMREYEANLRSYVDRGPSGRDQADLTPLTRRYFGADGKIHSDLRAHSATMKRVAAEMHVPLIDLQRDSISTAVLEQDDERRYAVRMRLRFVLKRRRKMSTARQSSTRLI